jgi:hypothetical protein
MVSACAGIEKQSETAASAGATREPLMICPSRKFILRRDTIAPSVYSIFNSGGKAKLTFMNGPRPVARKGAGPISAPTRFSAGKDNSMTIAVGDQIPDVKLMKATESGPEAVQTAD